MEQKVRLSDYDVAQIIVAFKEHFGPEDHLWLFGSRVDLTKRGGDIDLYVETVESLSSAVNRRTAFVTDLWEKIGEQRIDVVLKVATDTSDLLIYEVAKNEGVQLV